MSPILRIISRTASDVVFDLPEANCVANLVFAEFRSRPHFFEAIHGYPHWLNVFDNARRLICSLPDASLSGIQSCMTLLGAFLHDVGRCISRDGDNAAMHHAARSEKFICDRLPDLDLDLSPMEIQTVALIPYVTQKWAGGIEWLTIPSPQPPSRAAASN